MRRSAVRIASIFSLVLSACAGSTSQQVPSTQKSALGDARLPSQNVPALPPASATLIKNGIILTADDEKPSIDGGYLLLERGVIVAIGEGEPPETMLHGHPTIIDAKGMYVTPGLVDTHSHLGVYASPHVWAHSDGNEMTHPITSGVRAEDAFWPEDPGIQRAVAGGVTTIQVLPGSGNLMGGQGFTLKLHPRREVAAMKMSTAPNSLKMACGENPKRVYGKSKKRLPMSRMGSLFLMRKTWHDAHAYRDKWNRWETSGKAAGKPKPTVDLHLKTLADVLDGKILVHVHCYRADEMLQQIKIAHEFGFKIRSFHHAVEAYKIRDVLAKESISVSTWADWWGFKIEANDAIEHNLGLLAVDGVIAILHTDSAEGIQRMNQEAAKAMFTARRAGLDVSEHEALKWITINPAWALGVHEQIGSLEVGKSADITIWDRPPFSVYAKAVHVFIDGYERHGPKQTSEPWSDFEVTP